ncbi:poly-beta-hydroxybutyrate-responsive repressor [Bacillus sp. RG28]|uniref:Poly-beta-hydroxybutyrate-responsive repressor n=1 Tax=Gottfriedia endophytica TaxID=2820819 RepID=A0A940NFU2_9BACI|nr:poly-beta-hydroxybutyrate-responsive repressor [Gottfriedia endophytica]MBP0724674.1 poly-beta-hydroxybutyrate-responsive repressor [Gottfriedia endophytica]
MTFSKDEQPKNIPESNTTDNVAVPKNFLIPFLLLSLKQWNMHGYKLMQVLLDLGFTTIDSSNVYRTLRQLEKDHYIKSNWEQGEEGPAKRIYSITEEGEAFLKTCHSSFLQYQQMLQTFFSIYTNSLFPISNFTDKND